MYAKVIKKIYTVKKFVTFFQKLTIQVNAKNLNYIINNVIHFYVVKYRKYINMLCWKLKILAYENKMKQ